MATFFFLLFSFHGQQGWLCDDVTHTRMWAGSGAARGERRTRRFDGELRMRDADSEAIYVPETFASNRKHEILHVTRTLYCYYS